MSQVIEATEENFENEINTNKLVLIDFYAEWCGPCKMMNPVLQRMAESFPEVLKVIKVNVDSNQELASKYQVKSIPNLFLLKGGERVENMIGMQNDSVLEEKIKSHIE